MFSINAAHCACASETTEPALQFRLYFCSVILQRFMRVDLAGCSLDAGGFMVKMGSFVR
jgi:hypothetical protein